MLPRRIVPGQVWFVTRRCLQGKHLLRPDPKVTQIVAYVLALCAERTGIEVIAVIQMSNHWHLLLRDVEGRLPEFLQRAHWLISRAVNRFRKRSDSFFDGGAAHCLPVETLEDAVRIAAYIEANPVKDDLVESARDWPGLSSNGMEPGEVLVVPRPEVFFAKRGKEPLTVRLRRAPMPLFRSGQTARQAQLMVRRRVREHENRARTRRRQNRASVLGAKRVLVQSPESGPKTPPAKKNKKRKVFWSANAGVARRLQQREKQFQSDYSEARARWLRDKSVKLPWGTYWLRVFAGAKCEEAGLLEAF